MPANGKGSCKTPSVSLYFHIPFCTRKCPYCHFFVLPNQLQFHKQLLLGLKKEWDLRQSELEGRNIISIYFGGGTPWLLGPEALREILSWVHPNKNCEVTLEANPEHITASLLSSFREAGVNRLSIGVQSFDDEDLSILGREHTAAKAIASVKDAALASFDNISIDLMVDLPRQTEESWEKSLHEVQKLPITHLSLYNLTIEPHTAFFQRKQEIIPLLPSPETSLQILNKGISLIESIGLKRYEISAFAKEGYASRHNTGYWTYRPFLGFGPSAFSYWNKKRFRNAASLSRYCKDLEKEIFPIDFEEELPYPASFNELFAIHLRLIEGVSLPALEQYAGSMPLETKGVLETLQEQGYLFLSPENVTLTEKGLLFYDYVASEIV